MNRLPFSLYPFPPASCFCTPIGDPNSAVLLLLNYTYSNPSCARPLYLAPSLSELLVLVDFWMDTMYAWIWPLYKCFV